MAELADMINDLLSDPKTGEKLRALLDDKKEPESKSEQDGHEPSKKENAGELATLISSLASGGKAEKLLPEGIDPAMMIKLTRVMKAMNSKKNDERTRLLYDLKPYISRERGKRVDEAAEMLKLIGVLDVFRDEHERDED